MNIGSGDIHEEWEKLFRKVIRAQDEYIKFLGEEVNKGAAFLRTHNIQTPDDVVKKGQKMRDKIKKLKELVYVK